MTRPTGRMAFTPSLPVDVLMKSAPTHKNMISLFNNQPIVLWIAYNQIIPLTGAINMNHRLGSIHYGYIPLTQQSSRDIS